jgi:hypothetical protein
LRVYHLLQEPCEVKTWRVILFSHTFGSQVLQDAEKSSHDDADDADDADNDSCNGFCVKVPIPR